MRKILAAALFALAFASPALAQSCPPIPALPDTERRTEYTGIVSQTGPFNINFQLYGDGTDYANWLEVWVNGVKKTAVTDYTVTSPSGALGSLCLPISNAQVTFTVAQSGTIEIVGARRPRRLSQFSENRGVTAHDLNQLISDINASQRERWDREQRTLRALPGETITPLPSASSRASGIFSWDASGNPTVTAPNIGLGTVVGPNSSVDGHVALFDGTNGQKIKDGGALSITTANPTASIGLSAVNGVALTIMRSDAAPALSQAIAPTWTASHIHSPSSGVAITVNTPASSTTAGLVINNGSPAGTASSFQLNQANCGLGTADAIDAAATPANTCFGVFHRYGGAAMKGGRQSLAVQSVLTTPSNAANALKQYVAGSFLAQIAGVNDGGGSGTEAGAAYAFNAYTRLQSGSTFWNEATGGEINLDIQAGASAKYANVLSLVTASTHAVQGTTYDAMLALSKQAGAVGMLNGILIGPMNGAAPLDTTNGIVLATTGSSQVKSFVDFSSYTCSGGSAWKTTGATLDCSGNWAAGTYNKVTVTAPASAATLTLVTGSSLITSGANALTLTTTGTTNSTFPVGTDTLAGLGTAQTFSNQNTFNIARTIASATAATLNDVAVSSATTTITGNTGSPITALYKVMIGSPTLTDSSAVTVTNAATVYINGPPLAGGSVTLTNAWSLLINAGDFKMTAGRFLPGSYAGAFVPNVAQIYTTGGNGMTFVFPASGGGNDGGMFSASGGELFTNPGGTNDVRFNGGNGHFRTGATAPAVSSCGSSPSITGSDTAGVVTMGTGTPAACTITFNIAFTNAPYCVVTWQANLATMTYTVTNTAISLTQTATSSNKVNYHCFAQNAG